MQTSQIQREPRVEVAKMIDVTDKKGEASATGYTKNMSEGGLSARLDLSVTAGEILELSLALENGKNPVLAHGQVVWCDPDDRGEGAEVGLKFIEIPWDEKPVLRPAEKPVFKPTPEEERPEAARSKELPLRPGEEVTLIAGSNEMTAIVEEVVKDQGVGPVRVHLKIEAKWSSGSEPETDLERIDSDEELESFAEDWKPQPFRDIKRWFDTWIMPVVSFLISVLRPAVRFAWRLTAKNWKRIPSKPRVPIESLLAKLGRRVRALWTSRSLGPNQQ